MVVIVISCSRDAFAVQGWIFLLSAVFYWLHLLHMMVVTMMVVTMVSFLMYRTWIVMTTMATTRCCDEVQWCKWSNIRRWGKINGSLEFGRILWNWIIHGRVMECEARTLTGIKQWVLSLIVRDGYIVSSQFSEPDCEYPILRAPLWEPDCEFSIVSTRLWELDWESDVSSRL